MRKKLIDLAAQRSAALDRAEAALAAGNNADYDSAMAEVTNLNTEIEKINNLIHEQERQIAAAPAPTGAEARDIAEGRAEMLRKGGEVTFNYGEIVRGIRNATTLATGTLVLPTGAGENIHDPLGNSVSSIIDQVRVVDLTGFGSFEEPYLISDLTAKGNSVASKAGSARTASDDPTFGVSVIKPYDVNVTAYVDRNISRMSPANYYAKIYEMAMRAMRRKVAGLIFTGDGQVSPDMYGILNATNKAGNAIYETLNVTSIDKDFLDSLYFKYGSNEEVGSQARLYLAKADLKALGMLRNSDLQRVVRMIPDNGNPNIGMLDDSGVATPYCISSSLTALSASTQGAAAIQTAVFGDPMNYELGLFGDFTVRVDESIKGVERMFTILGDCFVGGNLIVDKGFVVATLPAATVGGGEGGGVSG